MTDNKNSELEKMGFEAALSKLEAIVEKLGSQKVDLEEMVKLYEEAQILKDHCNKKIADAKMKLDVVLKEGGAA